MNIVRRLWEMCGGCYGRCVDVLGKLKVYNTLKYAT